MLKILVTILFIIFLTIVLIFYKKQETQSYVKCPKCERKMSEWFVKMDWLGEYKMYCFYCKTISNYKNHGELNEKEKHNQ